jgi:uncharacterized membrane protein YfcA
MGFSPDIAIKVAFGTNLLVVLPTVMSSAFGHNKKGMVWRRAAIIIGIAGAAGAVIGATIASHLPGEVLKIFFGLKDIFWSWNSCRCTQDAHCKTTKTGTRA